MARAYRPKPCTACGTVFDPTGSTARYCSEDCRQGAARRTWREHYHRTVAADPGHNARRARKAAARVTEEIRENRRAAGRRYRARLRDDPDRLERARAYQRDYKRAWRAVLLSDPEWAEAYRAERRETTRAYQREWQRRWRASLTEDARIALRQERIERQRQAALAELLQINLKIGALDGS